MVEGGRANRAKAHQARQLDNSIVQTERPVRKTNKMESLILAQDERWRRA